MKKNLVVVGYGGQGGWHADHALKSDVVTLHGIYDIKQERIDLAKSKGINTYDSFEAVLADDQIDILVCATPNDVHKDIVIRALESGTTGYGLGNVRKRLALFSKNEGNFDIFSREGFGTCIAIRIPAITGESAAL